MYTYKIYTATQVQILSVTQQRNKWSQTELHRNHNFAIQATNWRPVPEHQNHPRPPRRYYNINWNTTTGARSVSFNGNIIIAAVKHFILWRRLIEFRYSMWFLYTYYIKIYVIRIPTQALGAPEISQKQANY